MGKVQTMFYDNWIGMNEVLPDEKLSNNVRHLENMFADQKGLRVRSGRVPFTSTGFNNTGTGTDYGYVWDMFEFGLNSGQLFYVIFAKLNNVYKLYLLDGDVRTLIYEFDSEFYTHDSKVSYLVHNDKFFIMTGSKFLIYGDYDYAAEDGTKNVTVGQIVKKYVTYPSRVKAEFYRAKVNGTWDLSTEDYENFTSKWDKVTYSTGENTPDNFPNVMREVIPDEDITNDLTPIKRCTLLGYHAPSARYFAAGDPYNPTAVYFSEVGKFNYFKEINVMYPTHVAGKVMGFIGLLSSMIVAYEYGWMMWDGIYVGTDAVWKHLPIFEYVLNSRAMCLVPGGIAFVSEKSLMLISTSILSVGNNELQTSSTYVVNLSENKLNGNYGFHNNICFFENKIWMYRNNWNASKYGCICYDLSTQCFVGNMKWYVDAFCVTKDKKLAIVSMGNIFRMRTDDDYVDINFMQDALLYVGSTWVYLGYAFKVIFPSINLGSVFKKRLSKLFLNTTITRLKLPNIDDGIKYNIYTDFGDVTSFSFDPTLNNSFDNELLSENQVINRQRDSLFLNVNRQVGYTELCYRCQIIIQSLMSGYKDELQIKSIGFEYEVLDMNQCGYMTKL